MKWNFLLLLFAQIGISQSNELNKLLIDGEAAFLANNFILAKENFTKATTLDPNNKDCWYNLAASELSLGENENACEHFYKVYLLDDSKVVKEIKEYCPNFRNGTVMSIDEVEEKPKFIVEGKEFPLFENKNLHPLFLKILIKEFKKSKILRDKVSGKVFIQIHVNKSNIFDGKIIRVGAESKDVELVKMEIMSILRTMVSYVSAKNKGLNVDLWEKWTLPINLK